MASPLQQINAGRRPVVLYAPGRQPIAAPAPRVGPGRPPPVGRMAPTTRRGAAAETQSPWSGFAERVTSTKAAQEAAQKKAQQVAEEEQGGFWGSDFGKGLGFVINNPVTRAVSMPLNYFQTLGRGVTLGMEELRQALPEGPDWLQDAAAAAPLGLAGMFLRTDPDRDESDKRSNWEKVFAPETSYGYGEIAKPTGNQWADRAIGFAGDVGLDPLTYVGAAGARAVKGVGHVSQAADELKLATRALDAATEAGKAKQILKAQKRLAQAEEYVARAPELGEATIMKQMPRTRAERAQFIAELEGTEEGQRIIAEFGGELQRAGKRGFHTASQELKDAMGIQRAGLRVRGATTPIPGTRLIGEGIAKIGGGLRVGGNLGLERLPERVQNLRVPEGLENSFKVLTREAQGDVLLAATEVASRNHIRLGTGSQKARGGRRIINMLRKGTKGLDKEEIQRLRREAETLPEPNLFNDIAKGVLETYQKITGRVIDPQYLRNSATYFPHLLDPKFRRVLAKASKSGDQAALDFMREAGLHTDELLEEGAFYVDNMLEGSGFLEKSRKFGTDPVTGEPRTVNIAGKEITFEADDLDHINDKFREAFPTYKGDFYDTDPARVLEAYNTSLARQAGRDMARQHLVDTKNPLAFVNTGDIRKTQVAMDEALSQQGAAPLLATAQGKYDPTVPLPEIAERPVVPGSAENRARQAVMTEAQGDLATARTPEELQAATEALEATPAPAPQFGDVVPEKYFVTTKGTAATAARDADVKRAQTYARAATAETRKAEAAVREAVAEVREEIVSPLRTAVADTKKEVTAINRKLRTWAKKVTDFGPLDADNFDDVMLTHSHINQEISNIETKIRRTRGQFKGRATRAQRKAENELKQSLDRLRKVRDDIQANVREAPARMKEEYDTRLEALDRPVTEAREVLARREAMVGPAPHGQADVDAAQALVDSKVKTIDDPAYTEAQEKVAAANEKMSKAYKMPREGAASRPKVAEAQATLKSKQPWVKRLQTRVRDAREKIRIAQDTIDSHRALQGESPLVERAQTGQAPVVPPEVQAARAEIADQQRLLQETIEAEKAAIPAFEPETIADVADLSIGDRVTVTSARGQRRGVRIDHISEGGAASGPQFKLGEPKVLLNRRSTISNADASRGRVVRVGTKPGPAPPPSAAVEEIRAKINAAGEIESKYRASLRTAERKGRTGTLPAEVRKAESEIVRQQQVLKEIDEKLQPLLEEVRRAEEVLTPTRTPDAPLSARARKMAAEAQADIDQYSPILRKREALERAGQTTTSAYDVAKAEIARLEEAMPTMTPKRAEQAQRKIDRIAADFAPGGKFAEEDRARQIIKDMGEHNDRATRLTANERAALERATAERATRQEAIIYASRGAPMAGLDRPRHTVAPGRPPSELEQLGWRAGEGRFPESITGGEGFEGAEKIPQRAAWKTEQTISDVVGGQVSPGGETVVAPGVVERPRPVPQPRTEVEALQSLQGQMQYGSPAQQATRIPLKQAEQDLLDAATRAPHQIVAEKAEIAEDFGKMADEAVGGDVLKTETFTNLAGDVNRKAQLVRKRDELTGLRDRINKTKPKYKNHSLGKTIDEIEDVARINPLLDDEKLTQTESILQTHRQELERIDDTKMRVSDLDRVAADAESGKLGNVMIAGLHDNWRVGHGGPLGEGDIVIATELHKRINNLFEVSRQPQALGRAFNAFTNLFKTYATLSPGFFVRNTIGGIFMNTSDGVSLLTQKQGADLWREFVHPETHPDWLDTQPRRVQEAFAAAFASGAGGRFEDAGVLARTNSRAYNMLSSNPATRKAQRVGSKVEGAMRLGMALDSFDKGMDITESLARISRVHFDYGQVSQLDDTMKRIIPFWTFMSRNLPLQIQQQWTNPRVYSYYDHLVQNFKLPDEEFTPDYWKRQGAWNTPLSIGGNQIYAQPDLGFTRVQSDIDMLGDALGGENAGALFGQANPALGATLDFLQQRDSFYNRAYTDADYKKMTGPLGATLSLIAKPLGQTNEAGQVSENFVNYLSSLAPPLNQAMRLLPEASGGERSADTWSKWARYGGVPTQLLTPAAQDSEYWRQWREIQDEWDRQRTMAREAAG